jgi:membrane fusion protein, heavy metal efflux system
VKISHYGPKRRGLAFAALGLSLIAGAALFWKVGVSGFATGEAAGSETVEVPYAAPTPQATEQPSVYLSDKQGGAIKLGVVMLRDFVLSKTAVGTIDFNENMLVQVSSPYQGKIIKAFSNVGDEVHAGDTLFTIDSPDLLQAESALLASAGVLELQKRTLARTTQLVKSGGGAQRDVDQATSDQQTAEGNFKAARNAVRIFGKTDAEIEQILAERKVDSTLIVASPISGRVITRNAAPGLLSQPGAAPAPYTVADLSTMWMVANVIETDAPAYQVGQDVEVRVPAYPDAVFKGRVTTLGAMIDANTHRQLVRSEIDDPAHHLRSGMFASFVIRVGEPMRSAAIPADSVVREGDGTMTVWVTRDRRRFERRIVTIGAQQDSRQDSRQDSWVQVVEGLEPGEIVVAKGAIFLSNKLATEAED